MNDPSPLEVPPWVFEWLSATGSLRNWKPLEQGLDLRRLEDRDRRLRLISVRARDAVSLDARGFEELCHDIYRRMLRELFPHGDRHPVRWWNFIPDILCPLGDFEHRYMAFNAGRYRAISERDRGPTGCCPNPATASGVGHRERDLVIHCLTAERRGAPVENPRQIPAYRYSERYGPSPPCFARATRVADLAADEPWLFVGGTASVLGEKSAHVGDLDRQLDETLANLEAVVQAGLHGSSDPGLALEAYRDLRVYFVDPAHREILRRRLREQVPGARLEMIRADLCRPDLLVEIEGLARPAVVCNARASEGRLTAIGGP